jgi:serine/threonine protein kinase
MDLLGRSINHYHITEQLGEGGMAIVYKAFDTHLERDVAVKVIRTDQFAPAILEKILKRFEREAKVVGKLSHPNIVGVIDYGEFEGSPYLVMPYLDGGTLKFHLNRHSRLPWQEAVRLLLPVADALQYAHEHNVLHRDVKPSNILLTDAGQPMLTDFGVAKVLEGDEGNTLTGTGVGLGTPEYMAPEQWQGQFSAQSDIYSLGVVLYEMIAGVRPYTADTPAAVLIKQITGPLRQPRDLVPDLPEKVERLLYKALAIKPEDRYENMGLFASVIRSLEKTHLNGDTVTHPPVKIDTSATVDEIDLQRTIEDSVPPIIIPPLIPMERPFNLTEDYAKIPIKLENNSAKKFWISCVIASIGWIIPMVGFQFFSISIVVFVSFYFWGGLFLGLALLKLIKIKWYQILGICACIGTPIYLGWFYFGVKFELISYIFVGVSIGFLCLISNEIKWWRIFAIAIIWELIPFSLYLHYWIGWGSFTGIFFLGLVCSILTLLLFRNLQPKVKH